MSFEKWYNGKTILILGGAGFIGSHLAKAFVKLSSQVIIVDGFVKHSGGNINNIESILKDIILYDCKIERLENLPELVKHSDLIIDSIGQTSHNFGMENPILDVEANLISHLHVINALKESSAKKVIYLGSRGQYGNINESVINENTVQDPIDVQAINKVAAESLYKIYANKFGYNVLSLRITNCFGENQKITGGDIGLIGSFIVDILNGRTVEIFGSEKRKKNFIYVKDLAKVITRLCASDFNTFEVYNIAGLEIPLTTVLKIISRNIGRGDYVVKPFPVDIKTIDVGESKFSDKKLRDKLGIIELSDLNEALIATVNYFKERLNGKK